MTTTNNTPGAAGTSSSMNTAPPGWRAPHDITTCTAEHALPDGHLHILGACTCVTGSMSRLELSTERFLVDCGIGQGREAQRWQFPDAARDVDAVILTHGHLDHIGALPTLINAGFDKPIFATRPTIDIARISLEDSLEMQRLPPRDIEWFLKRFDQLVRSIPYDVDGPHARGLQTRFAFREAGHILGSSSVEITSKNTRVIMSGDLGRPNSPILRDPNTTWDAARPVDLVVMESTYGGRDHEHDHNDIERTLLGVVKDAIAKKGKVFIPSFAIGRTQVLLWFLNDLVESGKIEHVPVALDTPMGLLVTETYQRCRKLFDKESIARIQRGDDPLDFDDLFTVKKGRDSARLDDVPGPMIIIAGAGMVTGGRIIGHLKAGLPDPKNTLLFVGHQAVGTPGRRIQEAAKMGSTVWLDGEPVTVRARIATLRGLSAHADRGELMTWLSSIPTVKRVALNHGEVAAQEALRTFLHSGAHVDADPGRVTD